MIEASEKKVCVPLGEWCSQLTSTPCMPSISDQYRALTRCLRAVERQDQCGSFDNTPCMTICGVTPRDQSRRRGMRCLLSFTRWHGSHDYQDSSSHIAVTMRSDKNLLLTSQVRSTNIRERRFVCRRLVGGGANQYGIGYRGHPSSRIKGTPLNYVDLRIIVQ